MGNPNTERKRAKNTDIESFQNRTTLQEIEIKEEKKKYTVPQRRRKNNEGKNNKQKGGKEGENVKRK